MTESLTRDLDSVIAAMAKSRDSVRAQITQETERIVTLTKELKDIKRLRAQWMFPDLSIESLKALQHAAPLFVDRTVIEAFQHAQSLRPTWFARISGIAKMSGYSDRYRQMEQRTIEQLRVKWLAWLDSRTDAQHGFEDIVSRSSKIAELTHNLAALRKKELSLTSQLYSLDSARVRLMQEPDRRVSQRLRHAVATSAAKCRESDASQKSHELPPGDTDDVTDLLIDATTGVPTSLRTLLINEIFHSNESGTTSHHPTDFSGGGGVFLGGGADAAWDTGSASNTPVDSAEHERESTAHGSIS